MKYYETELELNEMILDITNRIRENHPELLKYLNEMPITVPYQENSKITVKTLTSYYDSLVSVMDKYELSHTQNASLEKIEHLLLTEFTTMELASSYRNLLTEVNNIIISYNEV